MARNRGVVVPNPNETRRQALLGRRHKRVVDRHHLTDEHWQREWDHVLPRIRPGDR